MTAEELRNKDIIQYLASRGYYPKRNSGNTAMYLSPIGKEDVPSFAVKKNKNRFRCYHTGNFGSIIDLVMILDNVDFRGACKILEEGTGATIESYTPPKVEHPSGVQIVSLSEIVSLELLVYFTQKRRIDEGVLRRYCKEASFTFPYSEKDNKKVYTAVSFANDLGGQELRSSWQKIATKPKCYSTIKGTSSDKSIVNIIEGFTSFLSFLTHYNITQPKYTTYVLNGLGMLNILKPFISDKTINCMLDNDSAADKALIDLEDCDVRDMRHLFSFYVDMNDQLQME